MSVSKTTPSLKKKYLSLKGFFLIAAPSRDDKLHALKPLRHLLYSFRSIIWELKRMDLLPTELLDCHTLISTVRYTRIIVSSRRALCLKICWTRQMLKDSRRIRRRRLLKWIDLTLTRAWKCLREMAATRRQPAFVIASDWRQDEETTDTRKTSAQPATIQHRCKVGENFKRKVESIGQFILNLMI